jgi:1,4-alpha-glucan branching enzyme
MRQRKPSIEGSRPIPAKSPIMKHNKNHNNAPNAGPQMEPVRFEFTHPTARTVCLAGTFNCWQPETKPMLAVGAGRWLKETVLPAGTYEYCLVVDGKYMPDPMAKDSVPNLFGGRNSILNVRTPEGIHLAAAENTPLKM